MLETLHIDKVCRGLEVDAEVRYRINGEHFETTLSELITQLHAKQATARDHQERYEDLEEEYDALMMRHGKLQAKLSAAVTERVCAMERLEERTAELSALRALQAAQK